MALENQIKALKRYAKQRGYGIAGIIAEQGSELSIIRSGLGQVGQALKNRKARIVLVADISRLGREPRLVWQFIRFLNEHHITLMSMNGQLNGMVTSPYVQTLLLDKMREPV